VVVLDSASSIGGVWAKDRLYPGLKSNNMLGTYEYSDFPMDEPTFGVKPGQHVPGDVVHKYLQCYAERFDIYRRIRFRCKVDSAKKEKNGWILRISAENSEPQSQLWTEKLIVATGLMSEPLLPKFTGSSTFRAPLFHCRDFAAHRDLLDSAKTVAILGGSKSAWDVAYEFASSGVKVNWIISSSGHGPAWMAPPYVTPLKRWLEKLVHTRFLTWLSPCIWGFADGYSRVRRILHGTWVGRWIVAAFWRILVNDVLTLNQYDAHPETAKLKPWSDPFCVGASLSILNYPRNFFDLIRAGQIKIHISEVSHLTTRAVHLTAGEVLETDALICSTGWKHYPPITFLPEGIEASLGLPHYSSSDDPFLAQADEMILTEFPRLKTQPIYTNQKPRDLSPRDKDSPISPNQPYRLYRFLVPPSDIPNHSIGFAGMLTTISTPLVAQIQALWLTAYLTKQLPIAKSQQEIYEDALLHSQFCKWRYPQGYSDRFPDFVFDAVPYLDLLLGDLGLKVHRKRGWLREIFEAYGPGDYEGLIDEWRVLKSKKVY
jgi:Pyridine nucleotide-disulphide oxidoreductase